MGNFIDRPNRFIAHVKLKEEDVRKLENQLKSDGIRCIVPHGIVAVHVKNTGRCKELLISGAEVCLQFFPESFWK